MVVKNVVLAHLNCRSLRKPETRDLLLIEAQRAAVDILTVSETWFSPDMTDAEVSIPGFTFFRQDRVPRRGGGVGVYVRTDAELSPVVVGAWSKQDRGLEQLWVQVQPRNMASILIGTIYMPPEVAQRAAATLDACLSPTLESALASGKKVFLAGDFNCNLRAVNSPAARAVESMCREYGLSQVVRDSTRGDSLLDLVLCSDADSVLSCSTEFCPFSDHAMVVCSLRFEVLHSKPHLVTCRNFRNFDLDTFLSDLRRCDWGACMGAESVSREAERLTEFVVETFDAHAPLRRKKVRRTIPWSTPEIVALSRRKLRLYRAWKRSRLPGDQAALHEAGRDLKRAVRRAKRAYVARELAQTSNHWKVFNKIVPGRQKPSHQFPGDHAVLAQDFNDYYCRVGQQTADQVDALARTLGIPSGVRLPPLQIPEGQLFSTFQAVGVDVVRRAVMRMGSGKAPGPDGINPRLLKMALPVIAFPLAHLIDRSLRGGVFPECWKHGVVVAVPKVPRASTPDATRPITLLNTMSKVCERVAHDQLQSYLESNGRVNPMQSGSRKGHSTETLLLEVKEQVTKALDDKQVSIGVLIDLSKAFDSLDHGVLLRKLANSGIGGTACDWMRSYLTGRTQATRIGDSTSSTKGVQYGVPQGSILGPMLFGLYMKDFSDVVNCLKLRFFVDDTQGFASCKPEQVHQTVVSINDDLSRLTEKLCSEHLLVNPKKTQVIVFGTAPMLRRVPRVTLRVAGTDVEASSEVTNLGVVMDESLTMSSHVSKVVSKCLGALRQISHVRHLFDPKHLATLVDSLVFSRLYYCASVFAGTSKKNMERLQRVQNYASKVVLGGRKFDHASDLIRRLGWLRVANEFDKRSLSMSFKIRKGLAPAYLAHLGWGIPRDDALRPSRHERTVRARTQLQANSFHHRMVAAWGELPEEVVNAPSIHVFTSALAKFYRGRV